MSTRRIVEATSLFRRSGGESLKILTLGDPYLGTFWATILFYGAVYFNKNCPTRCADENSQLKKSNFRGIEYFDEIREQ